MRHLVRGIYNRLSSDAHLRNMLGTFDDLPSVFTAAPIPEMATYPFVWINASVSDIDAPVKNGTGRIVVSSIGVYSHANGDIDAVEEPAEYIRGVLSSVEKKGDTLVRGWRVTGSVPSGPVANDLDDLYGRVVSIEFTMFRPE